MPNSILRFSFLKAAYKKPASPRTFEVSRGTFFHRAAPELQFWGYEIGNVLASIAGIGGFAALSAHGRFSEATGDMGALEFYWRLLLSLPELVATLGIILLVLATFVVRMCLSQESVDRGVGLRVDMVLMRSSLVLAALTALWGANWMTLAAVCFASASALIRLTYHAPRYLKYGAAMLMLGGSFLVAFACFSLPSGSVAICLALNGFYVIFAGAMACASGVAMEKHHVTSGMDRFVGWFAKRIATPAVFWLPNSVKKNQPLFTSMWARLPWRIALALAVTATAVPGAKALVLASLCWVIGDIAFGAMDRPKRT